MDKKKLYTLFMAVLMAGSIFSFAVLIAGPQNSPPPQSPSDGSTQATAVRFQASGVEATVEQLFPTVLLTASTKEAEISKINSEVLKISGIKRLNNSSYSQQTTGSLSGPLVFVAEISIDSEGLREQIASEIAKIVFFSDSSVFPLGLVSLPKTVSFKNTALNLTQDHTFSNPSAQAYLNLGTIEGDKITVSLEASIAGSQLQSLFVAEEQNITAFPKLVSLSGEFEISSFKSEISASAKTNYSGKEKISELNSKIKEISGVSDSKLEPVQTGLPLEITFFENALVFEQDLNTLLSDFNGVGGHDYNAESKELKVFFDEQVDFFSLVEDLKSELNSLNFSVKEVFEPKILVEGEIELGSSDSKESIEKIKTVFEEYGIVEEKFLQKAKITATELVDFQNNQTYKVEESFFEAMVLPVRTAGEKVNLQIILIISRGKILSISASEAEATTD